MRVCFVSSSLYDIGGQQRVVSQIANSLSEKENLEITLAFTNPKQQESEFPYQIHKNISLIWDERLIRKKNKYIFSKIYRTLYKKNMIKSNPSSALKYIFSKNERKHYESFFRDHKYDVIIGVGPQNAALLGLLQIDGKKIGWLHSTFERYFETPNDYLWNQGPVYSLAFSGLNELVVLTKKAKSTYKKFVNTDVVNIYNPVTIPYSTNQNKVPNKIIFVGRIFYTTKGLDKLLDSIAILTKMTNQFSVDIVGDGADMSKFKDDVKSKELGSFVNIIGATNEVSEYYNKAEISVLPSTIEGFGLVVVEAMASKLPVISFKTEGPSEIINDGVNGYLIENFDTEEFARKIYSLLTNKQLLEEMSHNAYLHSKDFSVSKTADNWIDLIKSKKE